jgi:predicted CXXCH cytochrome family protein
VKRLQIQILTLVGCAFLICGIAFLSTDTYTVHAQDEDEREEAEYIGADECSSCHRNVVRDHEDTNHALALQDVSRRKDGILGDFDSGEDVRSVLIPGEDEPRPFTDDDIAFAVGAGRYVQHYLYEVDRNEYMVLPAQWNVVTETWEALPLGEEWPSDAYDFEMNCAHCHTTGFEVERDRWEDDAVQCEACHGPGSLHAELADDAGRNPNDEELVELRAAIYNEPDPQMCGQCHSQGTGPDGHPYPAGYIPGTDLHAIYELVPDDSASHWWTTGHARGKYMQYNEWLHSTHATSLTDMRESEAAADQCLTCHSEDARYNARLIEAVEEGDRDGEAPEALTVESAQWGVTCMSCHNPHTDSGEPANLVEEAYALCISCHTNSADADGIHYPAKEMFEGITLVEGIEGIPGAHFTAEEGPRCTTCHMQSLPIDLMISRTTHTFQPVLPGHEDAELPNSCEGCHDDLTVTDLQLLVDNTQAVVQTRLTAARDALDTQGADEDDAQYQLIADALDFIENDGSFGVHNYLYVDELLSTAERELGLIGDVEVSEEATPSGAEEGTAEPSPTIAPGDELEPEPMTAQLVSDGVRPITLIIIGAVIALLLTSAFLFFRKPGEQEGQ